MSTPVSATPPPQSRKQSPADLSKQMQRLINMQYEQQRLYSLEQQQQHKQQQQQLPAPQVLEGNEGTTIDHFPDSNVGVGTLIWNGEEDVVRRAHDSSASTVSDQQGQHTVAVNALNKEDNGGTFDTTQLRQTLTSNYGTLNQLHHESPEEAPIAFIDTPSPTPAARPKSSFFSYLQAESLRRSLCYGAIDGMLTGSGIVSTFCGMNLLSLQVNNPQVRALVIAFTASTCFADSVCMAVGHVWTTHVMASSQATERATAKDELLTNKHHTKGLLVDLLLSKGMLKIDAMSLADTLEGYPDMFVSALTGDAMIANASTIESISSASTSQNERSRSFGRLTELEMDPDAAAIQSAVSESRRESAVMMLGFSLFSVVPSLIFTWIPAVLLDDTSTINPNTVVVSLTALIMWCLGVWKSRFLDSNWLLFGIETVLVLLLCVFCAYGLGSLLNHLFLPEDYILEVAQPRKGETLTARSKEASHYLDMFPF